MVGEWLASIGPGPTVEPASIGARAVDPGIISELRVHLDESARAAADLVRGEGFVSSLPIRLSKSRLADLESCERRALAAARSTADPVPTARMLAGRALDQYIAHQLFDGRVLDPVPALAEMLEACGDEDSLESLVGMDDGEAAELLEPMAAAAAAWSDVGADWRPRLQSRATSVFADGDVICSGILDVELGGAGTPHPGVVVEVKSGAVASSHPHEVYLYALLVALRDRRAPAVVARWYPGKAPAGVPVTEGMLRSAAERMCDAMLRWAELAIGDVPEERPGSSCGWCPDLADCPTGRAATSDGGENDGGSR